MCLFPTHGDVVEAKHRTEEWKVLVAATMVQNTSLYSFKKRLNALADERLAMFG